MKQTKPKYPYFKDSELIDRWLLTPEYFKEASKEYLVVQLYNYYNKITKEKTINHKLVVSIIRNICYRADIRSIRLFSNDFNCGNVEKHNFNNK